MTLQEIAPKLGMNLEKTLALFMDKEDMYKKYLRKYPANADKLLAELKEAVDSMDYKGIEASAHGLKGVSANLGLNDIADISADLVADVRREACDDELIRQHYNVCAERCKTAIQCIENLE